MCMCAFFFFCQVRVGQDYRQAAGRPLDPFLEAYHGLSEVLQLTAPRIVAYIDPPRKLYFQARSLLLRTVETLNLPYVP